MIIEIIEDIHRLVIVSVYKRNGLITAAASLPLTHSGRIAILTVTLLIRLRHTKHSLLSSSTL
jgi:hypothetical protein